MSKGNSNESERKQLQILVSEKEAELQRLHDEIQLLKARQNALASISQLPVELLARAFFALVHSAWELDQRENPKSHYHRPPIVEVTHVCQHWRNVALSYPGLWAAITAASFSSRWAEEQLQRSKDAELYVQLPQERTLVVARRIFNALKHLPRFRSLYISARSPSSMSTMAPNLLLLFGGSAPKLRHITLNGCVASWSSSLFSGLTSLKLASGVTLETDSMGTLNEFLDAMERMPALAELMLAWVFINLQDMDAVDQNRVVRLPKLEQASFQITLKECTSVLRHLAFPASARVSLQTMALKDGRSWFSNEEVESSLLPALGSSLDNAFLSNPLSNENGYSPIFPNAGPDAQTPSSNSLPIRSLCLSVTDDNTGTNKAAITGWFQNIDFCQIEESPAKDGSSVHSEAQCSGGPSVPPSNLSIYLGVLRQDDMPSAALGHCFLRMLLLLDAQSIAMEGFYLPEIYRHIGELPSLNSVYLKQQAAVGLLRYIFESTFQTGSGSDGTTSSTHDDTTRTGLHSQDQAPFFAKLTSICIEGVRFGTSRNPRSDSVNWDTFVNFLRFRRDVLGLPIHRVCLYNCSNISEDNVQDVRNIASEVLWGQWT